MRWKRDRPDPESFARGLARTSLLLLLVIVTLAVIYVFFRDTRWVSSFMPNLIAELAGIVVVVLLINRVLERRAETERGSRVAIAFRRLRLPIRRHYYVWFEMYKASLEAPPNRQFRNVDYLDEDLVEAVQHLDFAVPAPQIQGFSWGQYAAGEFDTFRRALTRITDRYGTVLDVESVALMEELIDSVVMRLAELLPTMLESERDGRTNYFSAMGDFLRDYVRDFRSLCLLYNDTVDSGDRVSFPDDPWSSRTSPTVASARFSAET